MRQNIVLIVLDTARADAFEPYGASRGSTPAVADLSRAGTVVENARATAPWTLPSHVAMLTGTLARGLGVGQAATPKTAAPVIRAQHERLLAEVLRQDGYNTAALSANPWMSPRSGFDVGFDRFATVRASRQSKIDGGRREAISWAVEAARAQADHGAAEAARVMSRWIADSPAAPFFWFINLMECHSPYLPPRPYHAVSTPLRVRAAADARRYHTLTSHWRICTGNLSPPAATHRRERRLYAGSVRYVDAWIERFLEQLSGSQRLDETLILVTSDHGENLGEGGLVGHCLSLDDRLLRVPLIASGPGADAFAGLRSLAELPARVAAAVDLADHPWHENGFPTELPVAEWDPLAAADDAGIQGLVREWRADEKTAERLSTPITCAVDGRWKLIRRGDELELYDLDSDALELDPIRTQTEMAAHANGALPRLRAALDHRTAIASVAHAPPPGTEDEIGALEDQMRLLGYM